MSDAVNLEEAQYFIFVTQVFFCCMYGVVIWDWIVSLPREYRFIWKTNWSIVKASYLFCRYWVILVMPFVLNVFVRNHSAEACQMLFKAPVALCMWNQAGAEVVLLIRTYAFYNRNRYLFVALCVALTSVLAYQLYVTSTEMLLLPFVTPPFTQGPCFPMSKPHSAHILGFFMASLAFDAIVTSMTLYKAFRIRRECGATSNPLIQTFLREGAFYFVLISIANLVNGIFYLQPKAVMSAIVIPLSVMFPDILACRLILDLRQRGFEISQPTTATMEQQGVHRNGGHHRSLPLHVVDGSRSTMFDSMPSQHQQQSMSMSMTMSMAASKISFPPGTLHLTSLAPRAQLLLQSSNSDFASPVTPGSLYTPGTPGGGDGERHGGYGPLPAGKHHGFLTSMGSLPSDADGDADAMSGVKTRQNSSSSVETVDHELRDLVLHDAHCTPLPPPPPPMTTTTVSVTAQRGGQPHPLVDVIDEKRGSDYSDNTGESDLSDAAKIAKS